MKLAMKLLVLCMTAVQLPLQPVQAEETAVTWADCCLLLSAPEPELLWYDDTGEPRVYVTVAPQVQIEAVRAAVEAAPEWVVEQTPISALDALDILGRMGCADLPELPEDMTFEAVCCWAQTDEPDEDSGEVQLFMFVLVSAMIVAGQEVDLPLRIGFCDMDTGTMLMAGWLDE